MASRKKKSTPKPSNSLNKDLEKIEKQRMEAEFLTHTLRAVKKHECRRLREDGYLPSMIAEELQLEEIEVSKLLAEVFQDAVEDRNQAMETAIGLICARYDKLVRVVMPLAQPRKEKELTLEGKEVEVIRPPDFEAIRALLVIQRDMARMLGLNKVRIEHTGADGGAINVNVDFSKLSDDQIEKYRETGDTRYLRLLPGGT